MKLIEQKWNRHLWQHENTWIADSVDEIPTNFDPNSATGSVIFVIDAGATYMKNSEGKWQKVGTTEVIA